MLAPPVCHPQRMDEENAEAVQLPESLTLDEAFRAALYLTEAYVDLEQKPDEGLVLFFEYLRSDPARWDDWKKAVQVAVADGGAASPRS
jgi:hypothetical protein